MSQILLNPATPGFGKTRWDVRYAVSLPLRYEGGDVMATHNYFQAWV